MYINCGIYTTFRFQEVAYNKFSLFDQDQSALEQRFTDIEKRLQQEIDDRVSSV